MAGFQFLKDGKHYVEQTDKGELLQIDFLTGKSVANLLEGYSGAAFDAYTLSSDEQKILLSSETEGLYRHSFYAKYTVFDRKTKHTQITIIFWNFDGFFLEFAHVNIHG